MIWSSDRNLTLIVTSGQYNSFTSVQQVSFLHKSMGDLCVSQFFIHFCHEVSALKLLKNRHICSRVGSCRQLFPILCLCVFVLAHNVSLLFSVRPCGDIVPSK